MFAFIYNIITYAETVDRGRRLTAEGRGETIWVSVGDGAEPHE